MDQSLQRDGSVSMSKGLAIILMVLVHARFSHYGDTFINMFHMPLFFFMSGYCFKETYLGDFLSFFKKRVKGAYLPYVIWGLVFLSLHNVFFHLNIYNGEYGFRGIASSLYTTEDILKRAATIVGSMCGADQLLGGYWFLHCYFFAAIISFVVILCFRKRLKLVFLGALVLLLLSVLLSRFGLSIPYYIEARELLAASFMVAGFSYRRTSLNLEQRYPLIVIPAGAAVVALGAAFWPSNMLALTWTGILPYFVSAIAGIFMAFSLCKWLSRFKLLGGSLTFTGDRTLSILTWHFLSFKIVSLVIIAIYGLSIVHLAEFPVIETYAYRGWWAAYLIVGVTIPLLLDYCFRCLKKLFYSSHS